MSNQSYTCNVLRTCTIHTIHVLIEFNSYIYMYFTYTNVQYTCTCTSHSHNSDLKSNTCNSI